MCTRIYHWHYHSLPNAIGTLQGRGRDGSNFLGTAKMCDLLPATSLPAALCAGGSVFVLFRKRCTGGKMENGGLWREASLPATLGVVVKHGRHCMQVVATLVSKGYRFSKTENRPQNGNGNTHVMCSCSLALCLLPTYFLFSKI
jgi:hypothetical protein